ncbi:hypothetical protein Ais01nite_32620 [Asanoa ishikariensis]|uniref:GmrSD restriction endonucleases N-terminal domain-containing protein n=1 Tax=Asanoa ishikariensis TaxID=137265 RepID=A0A1H3UW86_9ACTN|nr:DUF262 domain-containing protein [Asanoa ishikariensis]GIF65227.1 hypothetical protein Ais01nite_32620 [Asanoa ishikariensis]SDZ66692.1 Protein of unknown function DUF262 [Asanoa ishikariensis]
MREQPEIRPDPTVQLMDEILDDMVRGRVRVPVFQRPFVWLPDQMLALFDSIERGYPIGSLLLWQTDDDVETLPEIGGITLPPREPGTTVSLVLDGHQRLSTLFGVLRRADALQEPGDWKWRIHRDLRAPRGDDRYRHHKSEKAVPEHYLPLRAVTRTMDFLRFSRILEQQVKDVSRVEDLLREAEGVAQRIKSYKMTVIRLQGASLAQAVEVYTRLNRTGTRMDADQMISALTHRPTRAPLAAQIDDIIDAAAASGFGEVQRQAVFRSVLAISGESDVMSPRWEVVAQRMQNRLHDAIPQTAIAIGRAVEFLQGVIGVPVARLLPYAHQLLLLAIFFHHRPQPTAEQEFHLRRWFWVTSWTGAFGGITSTRLRNAISEMAAFADGAWPIAVDVEEVQPMPETFNMNSARTRAYVIWECTELPHRLNALGEPFDLKSALADAHGYRPIVNGDRRPANRLLMPTPPGVSIWRALEELDQLAWLSHEEVLRSHAITARSWRRFREGLPGVLVDDRHAYLESRLRAFADGLGVPLGRSLEGDSDDDTD